ncbi:MAG: ABC transporter ATP-binding protein [Candidatus Omnitrophica bacterium]|jgi:ABC-type polysaccharide/polyol phosphate transport system ATPase subunit|nr:ABC transporter ATP-binding protein [Candidatus Omnitrophota bacterium]MDD5660761.1 ABC transporter ATP-binding protein [Candidatus Omnitrophota bacterium]
MIAIKFDNVWEKYRIKFINAGKVSWEEFWALEDISFQVESGQVLGIVGQNGAGKSTVLKLIAGMLIPDKGKVSLTGKVSTLMELGAGFNPELTGRENVIVNSKIYGLDEKLLDSRLPEIVEFAGLGRFIDAPIKYYSQGMYMRLAFALAIYVEPDILLIDDILAVGDEEARLRCLKKIFTLKEKGKTIILVSHDMDMIRKICDRVIFLKNGKVINIGEPDNIIPCYLDSLGDAKGIASLNKGPLRMAFNNGKLSFSYGNIMLTRGISIYMAALLADSGLWLPSFNLEWVVRNMSEDALIVEGRNKEINISQLWSFDIGEDNLRCQVKVGGNVKSLRTDLFLIQDYIGWSDLSRQENFGSFNHKSSWQEVHTNNAELGLIGLRPAEDKTSLPFLLFEFGENGRFFKLFNTGYEQEARVIQVPLAADTYSMTINFFPQEDGFRASLNRIKAQLALTHQAEAERLQLGQTISSGRLRIFCDLGGKTIRIYFKDKEITYGNGLHAVFDTAEGQFIFKNSQWQVDKISDNEMILNLNCHILSLSQVWLLRCNNENSLNIQVKVRSDKEIFLREQFLKLELEDKYESWRTPYEEGVFLIERYIDGIAPIRLKDSKTCQVILSPSGNILPKLSFKSSGHKDDGILSLYKSKSVKDISVNLNFSRIIPNGQISLPAGDYLYFEGEILLNKDIVEAEKNILSEQVKVKSKELKLVFDRGRGRIFWAQKELTRGLSLYTSLRHSGIWYDSYQALWSINKSEDRYFEVYGAWPYIPVSQLWQVYIEDNVLHWKVQLDVHQPVNLEIMQANLMLSCEYKNWQVAAGQSPNIFPEEYTQDYDILPFRLWYGKPAEAGLILIGNGVPQVKFLSQTSDEAIRGIIENTDYLYHARLMQYQKTGTSKLPAGSYPYFDGIIKIGNDK